MKVLQFTHPKMRGFLITDANQTREDIATDYIGDEFQDGDLAAFTVEEMEMTQEEFDALPEFEG